MEESAATPTEIVAENTVAGDGAGHIAEIPVVALADAVTTADGIASTLTIPGTEIHPGSHPRLSWSATELFEGVPISTPVQVELELTQVKSPHSGRIIGMARNQVVMPGFAAFHVGIQTSEAPVGFSDNDLIDLATEDESDDYVDGMSE